MIWVILSSILFGLVHPGSKVILGSGIQLIDFCFLYIGIRFVCQIPFFIKNLKQNKNIKKYPWGLLVLFGCVGASLQVSEFFGLTKGLSVATVTFLVYSHPIWSLILSYSINKEKIGLNEIVRVAIGIIGIYVISSQAMNGSINFELRIIAPILAGFLIALWSSLSNKLRKMGLASLEVSFFYDLFGLLAIISFMGINSDFSTHASNIGQWIQTPQNFISIFIYSIFIGLLPNFLFYLGSGSISNLNASLLLLIEPIVATAIAYIFMKESVSPLFLVGALFILLSGMNFINFNNLLKLRFSKVFRLCISIALLAAFLPTNVFARKLYLVELSPQNQTDYTTSQELKLIEKSGDLSFEKAKKLFPECKVELVKHLATGSEEDLYKYLNSISGIDQPTAIVGLSRSIFARVGAKALKDKKVAGYSIGASTAKLSEINKSFYSVASPLKMQVEAIKEESKKLNCQKLIGIFDSKDPLSAEYKENFKELFAASKSVDLGSDNSRLTQDITTDCVFIGINYSKSAPILQQISNKNVHHFFGTGDWSIHSAEIKKALADGLLVKSKSQTIHTPTGWIEDINSNSAQYAKSIQKDFNLSPNPIGAYTYDAILIAYEALCKSSSVEEIIRNGISRPYLLRNYLDISSSNNLISKMNIINMGIEHE